MNLLKIAVANFQGNCHRIFQRRCTKFVMDHNANSLRSCNEFARDLAQIVQYHYKYVATLQQICHRFNMSLSRTLQICHGFTMDIAMDFLQNLLQIHCKFAMDL